MFCLVTKKKKSWGVKKSTRKKQRVYFPWYVVYKKKSFAKLVPDDLFSTVQKKSFEEIRAFSPQDSYLSGYVRGKYA